jgi:hypothetical protein
VIGAVKPVELLKALSYRSRLGFDGTEQNLFMTLGRFLLFFVVGLVLAIAFPSTQLADLASCGFGRCCGGAFDSWLIGFNRDFAGH